MTARLHWDRRSLVVGCYFCSGGVVWLLGGWWRGGCGGGGGLILREWDKGWANKKILQWGGVWGARPRA